MTRVGPYALILLVVAAVLSGALLIHGIRLRLIWGSSGFVLGLACGVLLTMGIRHRRNHAAGRGA